MKNKAFRQLLIQHFSESELRTLCFDLGYDYELLPGREKSEKARELIAYYRRINKLQDLLQACQKARPQVEWPPLTDDVSFLTPIQSLRQKRMVRIGAGLLFIFTVVAFLIFITQSFGLLEGTQTYLSEVSSLNTNCFDTFFEDIQQDYQATVAVGESAHDFYFSNWGDRANPSLLGLRIMASGEPIANVRYLFLPGSSPASTAFEIVGVIDGNCQDVGGYSESSLTIENWRHLYLELPEKTITISFNWQGDHVRWGVRELREP